MENNKKEDMVFVSFDRLWDNFKKFWWIAVALMAVMLIYGATTYNANLKLSESKNDESTNQKSPVIIADNEVDRIHAGNTDLTFDVNLQTYYDGIGVENDNDYNIYLGLCGNVVNYADAIIASQDMYDVVNEAYAAAGYSQLITIPRTPGDTEYDIFSVSAVSDKSMKITYSGLGGVERIRLGTYVAAEYLRNKMSELYPYISCQVASEPAISLRVAVNGFYCYIQPDEASVNATREQYAEYNRILLGQVDRFDFEFRNIFQMSTIIKGVVGFVIGLFIIFVIAVCDKKVRTREELERFFDGEGAFLGEFKKNMTVSENVTAVAISAMCEKEGISNVILTTVGKNKNAAVLTKLAENASTDKVKLVCKDGIEVCPETSRDIAMAEGTIIMVNGGYDEVHTIKTALSRISTVNGKLLGYILCK